MGSGYADNRMINALLADDGADVARLLDSGAIMGFSAPLIYAAAGFDAADTIRMLLERGYQPDQRSSSGETPLAYAALKGASKCVKLLVEAGADLSAETEEGGLVVTALKHCGPETALFLVRSGADPDIPEKRSSYRTAAGLSICIENTACFAELIALGASPNVAQAAPGKAPLSCLSYVCEMLNSQSKLCEKYIRLLLKHGADPNGIKDEIRTPLQNALMNNVPAGVKLLVRGGADVNLARPGTVAPIILAAGMQRTNSARLLIKAGADLNCSGLQWNGEETPLSIAIKANNVGFLEELLRAGADIELRSGSDGRTPLHIALSHQHWYQNCDAASVLVDYGADLNAVTKKGSLMLAELIKERRFASAEFLLNAGADIFAACRTESGLRELEEAAAVCGATMAGRDLYQIIYPALERYKKLAGEDLKEPVSTGYEFDI